MSERPTEITAGELAANWTEWAERIEAGECVILGAFGEISNVGKMSLVNDNAFVVSYRPDGVHLGASEFPGYKTVYSITWRDTAREPQPADTAAGRAVLRMAVQRHSEIVLEKGELLDKIERLEAENARLQAELAAARKALEPFAKFDGIVQTYDNSLTRSDFETARKALGGE